MLAPAASYTTGGRRSRSVGQTASAAGGTPHRRLIDRLAAVCSELEAHEKRPSAWSRLLLCGGVASTRDDWPCTQRLRILTRPWHRLLSSRSSNAAHESRV